MEFIASSQFLELLKATSFFAAGVIGFLGVLIMSYGTLKAVILFVIYTRRKYELMTEIRIDVAKHLALGLEFLVAKDIIETAIRPTMDQLITLAFLVAVRTFIALILAREMKSAVTELKEEKTIEDVLQEYDKEQTRRE